MLPVERRNTFLKLLKLAYDVYPTVQTVPVVYANPAAKAAPLAYASPVVQEANVVNNVAFAFKDAPVAGAQLSVAVLLGIRSRMLIYPLLLLLCTRL